MEELIDREPTLKERRGKGIPVLAVLSWIYIGLSAAGVLMNIATGPMDEEQLTQQKAEILSAYTDEMLEQAGGIVEDMIQIIDISNANFYAILLTNIVLVTMGFMSVLWMYKLKKKGFYLYLAYSILPLLQLFVFYSGTFATTAGTIFHMIFGGLFCILYGMQVKRMD